MFETKAQRKTYEVVGKYLRGAFGEQFGALTGALGYGGLSGKVVLKVIVLPWMDHNATVTVVARCVTDLGDVPRDLLEYLLHQDYSVRYGAFSIGDDGDIYFEHSIVGMKLDKTELVTFVTLVGAIANEYGDKIVARWGGDLPPETNASMNWRRLIDGTRLRGAGQLPAKKVCVVVHHCV